MTFSSLDSQTGQAFFRPLDLNRIDAGTVPRHIAIIMDGNRRWARQRGLPSMMGHWEGAEVLTEVVQAACALGVRTLTVYSFSTENWRRPEEEVSALVELFEVYLSRKKELMVREGIRLSTIGDLSRFPEHIQQAFDQAKKETELSRKIDLVLAVNYGGRDEIRRAFMKILQAQHEKRLQIDELTEDLISSYLDTSGWDDPELMIRTGGEMRMSNFLLWQCSYTEIVVSQKLWPDFSAKDLLEAVEEFQKRSRRWGGG